MPLNLKEQLAEDMKSAMRARDKERLSVIRQAQAAVKQREVDESTTLDDAEVLAVIEKMIKQRRDAESQYRDAGREELADAENAEISVLEHYLPARLTDAELDAIIERAVADHDGATMRDMGKIMGQLKTELAGQADMSDVSARLKSRLQ
tara:strand:+ start:2440 stop:2889 length:450 start_codon:yes stop_codon:yes gene_type:complete